MIYLKLLWAFFQVGLFSFGGGYAALPLIQNQTVEIHGWLSMGEFADIVTISQMTPGPIAINSATFVGMRVGGVAGAVIATLGCILPSCIIVLLLAFLYKKYKTLAYVQGVLKSLHPAVVGMIAAAGFSIILQALLSVESVSSPIQSVNLVALILIAAAVFALRKWKLNPIYVMLGAGIVGGLVYSLLTNGQIPL